MRSWLQMEDQADDAVVASTLALASIHAPAPEALVWQRETQLWMPSGVEVEVAAAPPYSHAPQRQHRLQLAELLPA
jgi:hypothetical protein